MAGGTTPTRPARVRVSTHAPLIEAQFWITVADADTRGRVCERIATTLQTHYGADALATDQWTLILDDFEVVGAVGALVRDGEHLQYRRKVRAGDDSEVQLQPGHERDIMAEASRIALLMQSEIGRREDRPSSMKRKADALAPAIEPPSVGSGGRPRPPAVDAAMRAFEERRRARDAASEHHIPRDVERLSKDDSWQDALNETDDVDEVDEVDDVDYDDILGESDYIDDVLLSRPNEEVSEEAQVEQEVQLGRGDDEGSGNGSRRTGENQSESDGDSKDEDEDEDEDEDDKGDDNQLQDDDQDISADGLASTAKPAAGQVVPGAADDQDVPPDAELDELSGAEDWDDEEAAARILGDDASSERPRAKKAKAVMENADDDELARSKRTIFLGNVPVVAMTSRPVRKQLIRHIESMSPYPELTHVVSLRFRSVSFSVPTGDAAPPAEAPPAPALNKRQERARKFREIQGKRAQEGAEGASTAPAPLTAQQKRKIAYINQDLNEKMDTVHAYVRIAEPRLVQVARRDVALDERLTAPILAMLLARALDNTEFQERHLRADVVQALAPHEMIAAGLDQVQLPDGTRLSHYGAQAVDPKCTVFVGNLDFEAQEEEVRALFEKLLREERGEPPAQRHEAVRLDGTVVPKGEHPGAWVRSVRIVRDKATQMGKGFAYVKLADTLCVDELVALHEAEEAFIASARPQRGAAKRVAKPVQPKEGEEFRRRLKLRKRALRVSRCKATTQSGGRDDRKRRRPDAAPAAPAAPKRRAIEPKGRGPPVVRASAAATREKATYLASLSKEQRQLVKKSDPERQARRLEKKSAKKQADKMAAKIGRGREKVQLPQRSAAKKITREKKPAKRTS